MEHAATYRSIGFVLFVIVFLGGCPNAVEDASDAPTAPERFATSLAGTWIDLDCWLDGNTQIFHRGREKVFTEGKTFKVVRSMYGSSSCNTDPVARVTYFGTFIVGKEVVVPFLENPGKKVAAREIDYRFERFEVEGHRVAAQTMLGLAAPNTYYDINYVEGDFLYDGNNGFSESVAARSTQLDNDYKRASGLMGKTAIPSPNLDTALVAGSLAGTWDDGCFKDSQSAGFYQDYRFTFAVPNTVTVKSSLWSTSDCTGNETASITFSGTFTLVDNVVTAVSRANAARVKFMLGAGVVAGNAALAAASLPSTELVGEKYLLIFYDATYDLFFYGGWFEDSLAALPADIEYGIAKLGRAPLSRTARAGRK